MRFINFWKLATSAVIAMSVSYTATAKLPQLHVYRNDDKLFHKIEGNADITHIVNDSVCAVIVSSNGDTISIPMGSIERIATSLTDIPTLIINTPEEPELYQLTEKEKYLEATVQVDGNGVVEDSEVLKVQIKGRGNSTWFMPKKPMRLKFSKKTPLAGFKKAKNYVLLANYIDASLMRNAVAMKIAQLLEIPYTNHILPCNILFNGHPLGCFMLTEKIGINSSSVDIDELKGMLFELSEEFDEPYKFKSKIYELPVMVKDPDLDEIAEEHPELGTGSEILGKWQDDFNQAEALVNEGKAFEAFDLNSCVDYYLLYNLCGNQEIGFPKSFYIHKNEIGEKNLYKLGPVWDFDVAFDICRLDDNGNRELMFSKGNIWVNKLLEKMCDTPGFKERYKERLNYFYTELYPRVMEYFELYASMIDSAAKVNGSIWPADYYYNWIYAGNTFYHDSEVGRLRNWFQTRVKHLVEIAK